MLAMLISSLPMLLIAAVGLAFAVTRWRIHPRASMLAAIGFVCLLISRLVTLGLGLWMSSAVRSQTMRPELLGSVLSSVNLVTLGLSTIGMICITMAVFADRPSAHSITFDERLRSTL